MNETVFLPKKNLIAKQKRDEFTQCLWDRNLSSLRIQKRMPHLRSCYYAIHCIYVETKNLSFLAYLIRLSAVCVEIVFGNWNHSIRIYLAHVLSKNFLLIQCSCALWKSSRVSPVQHKICHLAQFASQNSVGFLIQLKLSSNCTNGKWTNKRKKNWIMPQIVFRIVWE